jgi:hypothetical protein
VVVVTGGAAAWVVVVGGGAEWVVVGGGDEVAVGAGAVCVVTFVAARCFAAGLWYETCLAGWAAVTPTLAFVAVVGVVEV